MIWFEENVAADDGDADAGNADEANAAVNQLPAPAASSSMPRPQVDDERETRIHSEMILPSPLQAQAEELLSTWLRGYIENAAAPARSGSGLAASCTGQAGDETADVPCALYGPQYHGPRFLIQL